MTSPLQPHVAVPGLRAADAPELTGLSALHVHCLSAPTHSEDPGRSISAATNGNALPPTEPHSLEHGYLGMLAGGEPLALQ